jgi:dTDP-4-amino-4,6-dideoxygalactose transaminase
MAMGERLVLERKARLFPEQLRRQQRSARLASEILADADVALPSYAEEAEPNFYVLPLRFTSSAELLRVRDALAADGVETHRYQRGISRIAASYYGYRGDCPNSEQAEETVLWVPLHYALPETDIERIAHTVRRALVR